MAEKETIKEKLANLFDGDDTNSNNIFDRVTHQMKSNRLNDKIDEVTEQIKEDVEKAEKERSEDPA